MVENVYLFLTALIFLFLLIVGTYYVQTVNKNKILRKKYMLGHWKCEGTSPSTNQKWQFNYVFNNNEVEMRGINPNFKAKGKYKVVREIENLLTIKIDNLEGDTEFAPEMLSIAVDKQQRKIYIDGRLYKPVVS